MAVLGIAVLGVAGCSLSTAGNLTDATPSDSGAVANGGGSHNTTGSDDSGDTRAEPPVDAAAEVGPELDATPDATPPAEADSAPPDAGPPGCPLSGKLALRIDADVRWDAKTLLGIVPVLDEGRGTLTVTILVELDRDGNLLSGALQACDAQMPDFTSSLLGETYATRFDHGVWEGPEMPRVPVRVELECPDPGCGLTVPTVTVLLGADLADPSGTWPTSRDDLEYPDHDGDGQPGVTLQTLGPNDPPGIYRHPPADTWTAQRADRVMLGIRATASLKGSLDSCDELSGNATFALDTHAPACRRAGDYGACTVFESAFVDDNLPHWTADSATFKAQRLDPAAGCAEAREAFAP